MKPKKMKNRKRRQRTEKYEYDTYVYQEFQAGQKGSREITLALFEKIPNFDNENRERSSVRHGNDGR